MKILVIEDDRKTSQLLQESLSKLGFEVECVMRGDEGFARALAWDWSALIVDIMLPGMDGLTLVKRYRQEGKQAPVLMLSARGELEQRIEGLDAGADDYLAKPFAFSELQAKLRALLRRGVLLEPTKWVVADLVYDAATREARRSGQRIELSNREALLLECLMKAHGRVVSRRDIIRYVWEYDFDPGTNLVEVYIRRLRDKLSSADRPMLVHNVRGLGYKIDDQP